MKYIVWGVLAVGLVLAGASVARGRSGNGPRAALTAFDACIVALHKVDTRQSDFEGNPSLAERGCRQSATRWFNPDGSSKVTAAEFCRENVTEAECARLGY